MDAATVVPSRRVDMWYEGSARQRRLTVGLRIFLLIPQVVVLFFLYIGAIVAVFIGWFGALFTGRLPTWVHNFVTDVLRWSTRVSAYGYLLTDQYPPFSMEDEDYPARPVMPAPGPLNRWSVLFRWVLVVPAAVFARIVQFGLSFPLLIVAWFIVLISGRMPPVLYAPYAALVRYEIRLSAWFWMLTSEYPWGMLGDPAVPVALPPPPSFAPGDASWTPPPPAGATEPMVPGPADATGISATHDEPSGQTPPPHWPPPMPAPTGASTAGVPGMPPPSPWERVAPPTPPPADDPGRGRLVLTGAARGWMVAAIVWGSLLFLAQSAIQAAVTNNYKSSTAQQFNTTSSDVAAVNKAILTAASAAAQCTTISTVAPSQQVAADKLSQLHDDLSGMSLPENAVNSARAVESDASQLATIFQRLESAPDCATYRSIARSSDFASVLNSYPSDIGQLLSVLHADATS
jgi:uncharacterized protein DUF4389